MTDHSEEPPDRQVEQEGSAAPEEPASSGSPLPPPAARRNRVWRTLRILAAILAAVGASLFVAVFSVDLGPRLRSIAEVQGSKFIERPMHIGRLSARLTPGVFVIEDLVIEGLTPQDRPFLRAKKITVEVPWWTVFSKKLIVNSVAMTDWDMVVESYPNGRHTFPKFTRKTPAKGPSRFTTTLRHVVALRGSFTYQDHVTPWSTVARDLNVQLHRPPVATRYHGRASFVNGTVRIQSYEPFRADMQSRFTIDNGIVHFDHIDLASEGARSAITGDLALARWPEQTYQVRSKIDFATQKNIFFRRETFSASGTGDFTGTFHLFKGGRELKGTFSSPVAGVNAWRFPNLQGSVLWVPSKLEITDATAQVYGGTARFDYRMAPFGQRGVPTRATWGVEYRDVDLAQLTTFLETRGLRLAGRASGKNRLEWPMGKWGLKAGAGEVTIEPPSGVETMTRELRPDVIPKIADLPLEPGPFRSVVSLGYVPVAGRIVYSLDPEWIVLDTSWAATESTFVQFEGRTAYGERSRIPFHVTSADWQESDRLLAGIMTAFGAPTGPVAVDGNGEFDGVMLASFTRPRIEGTFRGDRLRGWNVVWGRAVADVVIENNYAIVSNAVVTSGSSEIRADGQFSLGYPRKDQGEEIDARVRLTRRPLRDLRQAFELDYPMEGLVSGDFHVYGPYERPFGFGKLTLEDGVAYGERFERATASLRFEGNGVRLDSLDIRKSSGAVTGAAFVGWTGDYSFNADGTRIPVESLERTAFPQAPPSGLLQFSASGAGTFDSPRYDVKVRVDDLYAGDEGIGQLNGRLSLRGEILTLEMEAASPRLVVSGSGRIALTPQMESELNVRFADTSLDPYLRFFEPRLSPFTTAIAGGTLRVVGELADVDRLVVEAHVESLELKLFDYRVRNAGNIDLRLDRHVLEIDRLALSGEGTELQVQGHVAFDRNEIAVQASGDANLGILQGFYRDLRSRGTATIKAQIGGALDKPILSGNADVTDGRIRFLSVPNSIEAINGRVSFDAGGIRLDDVAARLGEGEVRFGGRIGVDGFALGDLNLTATGERMRIRYPQGFVSTIDANLSLQGTMTSPVLSGNVLVRDAVWSRRLEATPDFFNLAGGASAAGPSVGAAVSRFPLRLDIDIDAPSSLRIENNIAKMVASADLKLQGTYDRPQLLGHMEIDRGDLVFEGNRYLVTRGGVDFFNASRIEPVFDIEAETRVRVPGQTYNITLGFTGTSSRFSYSLNSDPPLPEVDVFSLLLGQATDLNNAELRALRPNAAQQSEEVLLRQAFSRLLTNPLSAPVSRILGETLGIETVIAPTFGTESDPLTPSARLILGRRLSNRAYLTFARALGGTQREQIIILEYDQNDRVGWVITQNGDRTFALDFRVRHRF